MEKNIWNKSTLMKSEDNLFTAEDHVLLLISLISTSFKIV